jgi:large subunit ribosomal protein L18
MENSLLKKNKKKSKRSLRVRRRVRGTGEMPRLCVVKTNLHVHVQLIDDESGQTLVSTSTIAKEFQNTEFRRKNRNSARQLGLKIAELAKGKDINNVVFDRGPFKYHGVIAAVADGAREGGLNL